MAKIVSEDISKSRYSENSTVRSIFEKEDMTNVKKTIDPYTFYIFFPKFMKNLFTIILLRMLKYFFRISSLRVMNHTFKTIFT